MDWIYPSTRNNQNFSGKKQINKQKENMKKWFSRHYISINEGQQSLENIENTGEKLCDLGLYKDFFRYNIKNHDS